MTQLNIRTTDLGWGDALKPYIEALKSVRANLKRAQEEVKRINGELDFRVSDVNQNRKTRVIDLLRKEERGICLLHPLVFRGAKIEDTLFVLERLRVVSVHKSWEESHRQYDSEREYTQHSAEYESVGCDLCRNVLTHGSMTCGKGDRHSLNHVQPMVRQTRSPGEAFEVLYSEEVIDKVSSDYYQMTVVTRDNIDSLVP